MAPLIDSELFDSDHFVYTIHSVIPLDKKQAFEDLQHRMNKAACCFDGYRGQSTSFQDKDDGQHLLATTRIVFEALNQCLHWLDSSERRRLLYEAETFWITAIKARLSRIRLISGFKQSNLKGSSLEGESSGVAGALSVSHVSDLAWQFNPWNTSTAVEYVGE